MSTQVLERPTDRAGREVFDLEARVNRRALEVWPILQAMLTDVYGRPHAEIIRLGDPDAKIDAERRSQYRGPRLSEFRINTQTGVWVCRGWESAGAQGPDVISVVHYLSGCDRKKATEWLASTLSRIVPLEAA